MLLSKNKLVLVSFSFILMGYFIFNHLENKTNIEEVIVTEDPMMYVINNLGGDIKYRDTSKYQNSLTAILNKDSFKKEKKVKAKIVSQEESLLIFKKQYTLLKKRFKETYNPRIEDNFGFSLMMYAVIFNDLKMIEELLSTGVNFELEDKGQNILFLVISNSIFNGGDKENKINNIKILELLINNGLDISNETFKDLPLLGKYNPLTLAARFNNIEVVKLLLDNGLDINARDLNGKTVLMEVLKYRNKTTIELLLNSGANKDFEDYNGKTVSHYAYETGDLDLIKRIDPNNDNILKVTDDGTTALMMVSKRGNKGAIKYFLDKGVGINDGNDNAYNPLIEAVRGVNIEGARYLVEQGALIPDNLLMHAAYGEFMDTPESRRPKVTYEMMEYVYSLMDKNVDYQDFKGSTALKYAASANNVEAIKFLMDKNANPNIIDNKGYTALSAAEFYKHEESIKILKEYVKNWKK